MYANNPERSLSVWVRYAEGNLIPAGSYTLKRAWELFHLAQAKIGSEDDSYYKVDYILVDGTSKEPLWHTRMELQREGPWDPVAWIRREAGWMLTPDAKRYYAAYGKLPPVEEAQAMLQVLEGA